MLITKSRAIRFCLSFAMLTIMMLSGSALAFADGPTVTTTITGGSLSEVNNGTPTLTGFTLNGADHTPTYTMPITLTDLTGNGAGWNLTITSTLFTNANTPAQSLSATASTITGTTALQTSSGTDTTPTNGITGTVGVPAAATAPTPVKFFSAATNTGMGVFTITPTVQVAIPANTHAGTYSSTISLAVVSGP